MSESRLKSTSNQGSKSGRRREGFRRRWSIDAAPVDAPSSSRYGNPDQLLRVGSARVVVKGGGALVKAARVRRAAIAKTPAVEMMTELVAKRAEEGAEGRNLLANSSPRPNANQHGFQMVVAEKFGRPSAFAYSERPSGEHAHSGSLHVIEIGGDGEEVRAGVHDRGRLGDPHGGLDGGGARSQTIVLRNRHIQLLIARQKLSQAR